MTRVLVTGAQGFIGRHALTALVARGFEVHAVTRRDPPAVRDGCAWHVADLFDSTAIASLMRHVKPTHLLHFAWYAVPGRYWTASENFVWVQASLELMRRFQEVGGRRAVMAGTCAEYDWDFGYCSEGITPTRATTPYGACKLALQTMLDAFRTQMGVSTAWGRIFFLYGPHEHPSRLVSSVTQALLRGDPVPCSHGAQLRDFLYVQDVADAFVALLESEVTGPVNVASGQPVAIKDVVYKIADMVGRRDLIRLGALPTPPCDPPLLCADVRRLGAEVGWAPAYGLEAGLAQTMRWWQERVTTLGAAG